MYNTILQQIKHVSCIRDRIRDITEDSTEMSLKEILEHRRIINSGIKGLETGRGSKG
jgi:hypothetical protein